MKSTTQWVCLRGPILRKAGCLIAAVCLWLTSASAVAAEPLTVGSFQIVGSKRLTRTDFEYTLRASVVNTGPAVRNVSASLTTVPDGTTIIDGSLTFGNVGKGATVPSTDTFVIRRRVTTTFNPAQFLWTVSSEPIPFNIKIVSPEALDLFSTPTITVSGTAGPDVAEVGVNGFQGVVAPDGNWTVVSVPLREGNNVLTAVAYDFGNQTATDSIQVTLDATAPRISITSPEDGAFFTEAKATITGNINDVVVGTVNGDQATVAVNGVGAVVANRTFSVVDLPLALGPNTITAVGADKAGNQSSVSITLFYNPVSGDRINLVSGNNQSAGIGELLPQPLVVQALDGNGQPVTDKKVIFNVTENDGQIIHDGETARSLLVACDSEGKAQVHFRLGTRAGAGNNQVSATIVGFEGEAIFAASATPGTPGLLVWDAGNNQIGVVGQPLPKPLVTIVVDAGNNRLHNIPVTFTVTEGGGSFNGHNSVTVSSDSDGRSQAILTLGPDAGNDNNIVEANFPANTGSPVRFVASSRVAGDELETSISGVVLDNSDIPVPGVLMRILGYPDAVQTDEKGHFQIKPAPVGNVRLIADGSTATRPGEWVWLQFDIVTIAGQDNDIGRPIRLVEMDMEHALFVDETHGGILTLPHAPGYSLNIAPGSVTFPNGTKSGHVSVTIVHPDKMPDPPSFGQQPRFLVSIQPANAVFNPPAQMCIPNLDSLPPGQKTDMYSYDHDMERFISIGTGTVSEDGLQICSDPGNGVIKGGWHCGGNPQNIAATIQSTVSVDKNEIVLCDGQEGTVTATGSPTPPHDPISFEWDAGGTTLTTSTLSGTTSTATIRVTSPGEKTVRVRYRCKSAQWSAYATIRVIGLTDEATPTPIIWPAAGYTVDNNAGDATTVERPFSVEYSACRDEANGVWRLRVKRITGGVDIAVHLGGYTAPNPGVNITTEQQAVDAINDMLLEGAVGGPATKWVTEAAIRAHEDWHYDEWKCSSDHYWAIAEPDIEALTAPIASNPTEAAAIATMRAGANGADAKIQAFKDIAHQYWFTLSDNPGSRPYRAGGEVLNQSITALRNYAQDPARNWTVPGGLNPAAGNDHCYQPFLPFTP